MQIAKILNKPSGQEIVAVGHYKVLFPNTSFSDTGPNPEWMLENSCVYVQDNRHHDTATQKLVVSEPYIEGSTVYIVKVVDKSAEDFAQEQATKTTKIRQQRNKLLQESDWTQTTDSPVDRVQWAMYRQQLRDVTKQSGFPDQVVWPTPPQS